MSADVLADRWVRRLAILAAGLALVSLSVGLAVFRTHLAEGRRVEARKVAQRSVVEILSYRPASVLADLPNKQKLLGPPFRKDYTQLVKSTVASAARKKKITARAKVVSSGVVSAEGNTVKLLMFVNVTTTTAAAEEPEETGSRLRVTMRQTEHKWRIVELEPV